MPMDLRTSLPAAFVVIGCLLLVTVRIAQLLTRLHV